MGEHNQRFDSYEQWTAKASSWLTRHPDFDAKSFRAYCFDAKGRRCWIGADFQRARDEGAFPVRWLWPDQIGEIVLRADEALQQCAAAGQWLKMLIEHIGIDPEATSLEISAVSADASRSLATVTLSQSLSQSLAQIKAVLKPEDGFSGC